MSVLLEYPYQAGRHGLPCAPPAGLSGEARGEWVRKWNNGRTTFEVFQKWDARQQAEGGAGAASVG